MLTRIGMSGILAALCGSCIAVAEQPPANVRLKPMATFKTGIFDGSAAEIPAYHPATRRIFVTNSADSTIDILRLVNPRRLVRLSQIDLTPWGAGPNSVAVYGDLVAVAVEASVVTDPGRIAFFTPMGQALGSIVVGALPDMITFTPDGKRLLVANEGEADGGVNPPGSVSIIDLSSGLAGATVTTIGFEAYDGRENELRARNIRIFPGIPSSLDLEPEYIAVSPDGATAFVTLQEANAFAVIDLATNTLREIIPAILKDHSKGLPSLQNYDFPEMPVLGTTATVNPSNPAQMVPGQQIRQGGFSGLFSEGIAPNGNLRFVLVPDRGPNGEPTNVDGDPALERPFVLPGFQPRIQRFELNESTGAITITQTIMLTRADGITPLTGLPNIPGIDEEPADLFGNILPYDSMGADLEGVVVAADGTFWTVDEYRPAIYHFTADGRMIDRFVPQGTGALAGQPAGTFGTETLPAEYSKRRPNRGFEAMAIDQANNTIYAWIQTPLANPNTAASNASDVIRVLAIDMLSGQPTAEYVYLLEGSEFRESKVDKMADAVFIEAGRFYAVERDDSVKSYGKKMLFEMNLKGATNLLAPGAPALLPGKTLEQHSPDDLAAAGIRPVNKIKVANFPSLGYTEADKLEGVALLDDGRIAVLNDNDFGIFPQQIPVNGTVPLDPEPTPIRLGILSFSIPNGLDSSDQDGQINITNRPVYGMLMPDATVSFSVGGEMYYISANEGDSRDEAARIRSRTLDPDAFPNAAQLKDNSVMGRLDMSTINGDIDGDGDYDQLWVYGGRSVSIWDRFGNMVSDTGDLFEMVTAMADPMYFNSNHTENNFDNRSDNKGPEPEAVAVGSYKGRTFAFVGLERVSGIVVLDITDPIRPRFVDYYNNRNFAGDPEQGTAGDLGPEGIVFVPADQSPIGTPILIVTNEVSGSTTVYQVVPAGR